MGGARDLTGDGVGDVVVQSKSGALNILTGGASGILRNWLGPFSEGSGLRRISSAQMAGGAQPDVVGVDRTGKNLVVVLSNGLTNLGKPIATNLTVKDSTQVLSVGDWNRGGKSDVITREDDGDSLVLHRGNGAGTFSTPVLMSKGWKSFIRLAAVGDVTGDKLPDLMGKTASGPMTIFPSNGKTGFLAPVLAPSSLRTFNEVSAATPWKPGDLPGSAFISSDGSFVPFGGTSGAGDLAGYDWVIGPGDVDGDGVADLVVHSSDGRALPAAGHLPGLSRATLHRLRVRFLLAGWLTSTNHGRGPLVLVTIGPRGFSGVAQQHQ